MSAPSQDGRLATRTLMERRALAGAAGDTADGSDPLRHYLRELAPVATLGRDEEIELATRYRFHTEAWQRALLALPFSARAAVARWQRIRREGRVTSTLSAAYRERSGADPGAALDAALSAVERALARRDHAVEARAPAAAIAAIDRALARGMAAADLSPRVLEEILGELRVARAELATLGRRSRRRAALERAIGAREAELSRRLGAITADLAESLILKQRFVRHNLKLVVVVAKQFQGMGIAYPDLIQEGNLGLIRAVEKFDPRQGNKFSTYAVWWIWQACIRAVQIQSRTVRLPSQIHERLMHCRRAAAALERRLGREATEDELAAEMGAAPGEVHRLLAARGGTLSIDAPLDDEGARTLQEVLEDPGAASVADGIDQRLLSSRMEALLQALDARERTILLFRFGLAGRDARTLQELGDDLGLSRERVRQLELRALDRLRGVATALGLRALVESTRPPETSRPRAIGPARVRAIGAT